MHPLCISARHAQETLEVEQMSKRCEIERYLVPQTDPSGKWALSGLATSQVRCTTHSWYWERGAALTDVAGLCPVGRIEDATEAALEKINHAYLEHLHMLQSRSS